ncbi:right-handed parallel beta-helix repeat-containing protein [Natrinema salaciae]|uniref:Right handed beta helix region n=1 Tax=Natrinema salaciae TaxID=1186196 RepID=A0A1H9A5H7_9EURY|nr:right-handed parallel beta-helix repeat-containing protein [Natrinema salaciae]SEP71248.1 hypothetical protein SAMN04489841_0341 [Natrinema salaciae]
MARDYPGGSSENPVPTDERTTETTIDRRSYLKLAGVAAIATGTATGAANAASGEYETIAASGQTIRIDSGETWENKLIDLGTRNSITIVAKGTDWTIRNIGFTGEVAYDDTLFAVADTGGGTSRMENIYFDECPSDRPTGGSYRAKCIWVDPDHNGSLEVSRCNFSANGNNGIYGSAPAYNGDGGDIVLANCYTNDSHHTGLRIGDCGMKIVDSVVYKSGSSSANRGIWIWGDGGDVATLENVHVITNGAGVGIDTKNSPNVKMTDVYTDDGTGTDGNPDHFIPDGCPESAKAAASGSGNEEQPSDGDESAGEDLPERTLTIIGQGDPTEYYVETTGEIVRNPDRGTLESHDAIDGTTATGWVTTTSNVDGFRFDGELVDVGFHQGRATVEVDGEEIDPDEYGEEPAALENTILIDGFGTAGTSHYEFAVSGAAEKSTIKGATIDGADTIDSGTVVGSVGGWRDAFRFAGELESLTVDGDARVSVNGELVDPTEYGAEFPHVLTIVGNGSQAEYTVTVDGRIETIAGDDSDRYATVESGDTVVGSIERGVQRFRFSGSVSNLTFHQGSANVYADQEELDPDAFESAPTPPHSIVIDGSDASGTTEYEFTVDGDVVKSSYRDATLEGGDVIDGRTVTGSVDDDLDAYWFEGDITDFWLFGDASVDVEYDV